MSEKGHITEIIPEMGDMPDWMKEAFDSGQFFAECRKKVEALETQKKDYVAIISDYISGTCRCPHSKGAGSHFPGCPKINADKVEQLEAELQKRVSKEAAQEAADAFKELLAEAERNHLPGHTEYYSKWLGYFQERS